MTTLNVTTTQMVLRLDDDHPVLVLKTPGVQGPPGSGGGATISPIADNQLVDNSGLYVPGTIDLGTFN